MCEQRRGDKSGEARIKHLSCSRLALNFASNIDPANLEKREDMHESLLRLQAGHLQRLAELNALRNRDVAQSARQMQRQTRPMAASSNGSVITTRAVQAQVRGDGSNVSSRIAVGFGPSRLVLPEIQMQASMSTTFITAEPASPEFGRAALTSELAAPPGPFAYPGLVEAQAARVLRR